MACEISGYFPPGQPEITWMFDDIEITGNTDSFNISTRPGSGFIQNGGENVIPSIISELSVFIEDSSYFSTYVCQTGSNIQIFNLMALMDVVESTVDTVDGGRDRDTL